MTDMNDIATSSTCKGISIFLFNALSSEED